MSESPKVDHRRLLTRWGIALVWILVGYYTFVVHVPHLLRQEMVAWDSYAYWRIGHVTGNIYATPPGDDAPYFYSPAFAALVEPLSWLPHQVFAVLWATAELVVIIWLLKPGKLRWTIPLFVLACVPEVMLGNVYAFLALALVLSLSPVYRPAGPAATAFLLLTKITPGLPVLWFLLRREWRALCLVLVATVAAALVSLVLGPARWVDWFDFLRSGTGPTLWWFPARVAVAVALVVFAARRDRPSLVPVAVLLVLPVIGGTSVLTLLAAVPRLMSQPGAAPRRSAARSYSRPSENAASRS